MASKPGFFDYVSAAFSARPLGMFVAPNWIGLAAAGLLGVVNPGFWVLGAGLELAYLLTLSTNGRFQRLIDARQSVGSQSESLARKGDLLNQLPNEDKQRFAEFEQRAQSILALQRQTSATTLAGLEEQNAGLNRLAWMYLRLLSARRVIEHVLEDADVVTRADLETKRAVLQLSILLSEFGKSVGFRRRGLRLCVGRLRSIGNGRLHVFFHRLLTYSGYQEKSNVSGVSGTERLSHVEHR